MFKGKIGSNGGGVYVKPEVHGGVQDGGDQAGSRTGLWGTRGLRAIGHIEQEPVPVVAVSEEEHWQRWAGQRSRAEAGDSPAEVRAEEG